MNIDIMIDVETLGKKDNTAIFQIYAEAFNKESYEIIDTFEAFIDINTVDPKLIDMDALYWWTQNYPETFRKLTKVTNSHKSEGDVACDFYLWLSNLFRRGLSFGDLSNNLYIWGNGSVFDNVKIKNFLQRNGFEYPIFYRNDMDLRTILRLASEISGLEEEQIKKDCTDLEATSHDAKDDVKFQIRLLQLCENLIKEKQ